MPLSPRANAPQGPEFCGQTVQAHIEYLSRRFRLMLEGIAVFEMRKALLNARGFLGRWRVTLAGNRERLVEILDVEPILGAKAPLDTVFPELRGLDVEFSPLSLIARLNAIAGDSPLPAQPENVAMQGHDIPGKRIAARTRRYRGGSASQHRRRGRPKIIAGITVLSRSASRHPYRAAARRARRLNRLPAGRFPSPRSARGRPRCRSRSRCARSAACRRAHDIGRPCVAPGNR